MLAADDFTYMFAVFVHGEFGLIYVFRSIPWHGECRIQNVGISKWDVCKLLHPYVERVIAPFVFEIHNNSFYVANATSSMCYIFSLDRRAPVPGSVTTAQAGNTI